MLVCFCGLTSDWMLTEASVRGDYMAFSWEFILHLELILSGREHIMGTVASYVTHSALSMMRGCDNCSLLIGQQLPLRLPKREKKNHAILFALCSLYIWLSWDIKDIKAAGLSVSEGWQCVTAADPWSSLMMLFWVEGVSWLKRLSLWVHRD